MHQPFEGVVGILAMMDAHMGKEGDMWQLIVFKRDFVVCTSLSCESMTVGCMVMISSDT